MLPATTNQVVSIVSPSAVARQVASLQLQVADLAHQLSDLQFELVALAVAAFLLAIGLLLCIRSVQETLTTLKVFLRINRNPNQTKKPDL